VAARLEGLATPGGICISGDVYNQVRNRIKTDYQDMGLQEVKNVSAPVQAYAITVEARVEISEGDAKDEIPSIAVLPFDNMSGGADQESFADGMTEDLITDLSKISGLFVVARNSTFSYKGQSVDVRKVAEELGVRYVLEGSVRRAGDKVRINAQLIDSISGGHLWADRYDGTVNDVFELQDEVCAKVVDALSVRLTRGEESRLKHVHTTNLEAYELFVRARATPYPPVPDRIKSALEMFERVIEMDPEFAGGYAGVSSMLSFSAVWDHSDPTEVIARADALAQKAIAVDDSFGWSYTALGLVLLNRKRHSDAIAAARAAIIRQPGDADAHGYLGLVLGFDGQTSEAIAEINQALKLNPQFINGPYLNMRGLTEMLAGEYDASIESFLENIGRGGPVGPPAICWGAASYVGAGRKGEAKDFTARLKAQFPGFSMTNWNYPALIRKADVREKVIGLMREAGVPED